jgi:magnesium and cobalt transporter
MREMQRGRGHLAAVLDEYGGTAGVVTLENLLKDLVSAVFVAPPEQAEPDDATPVVELEGSAPAARLEEAFGLPRDGGRAESVGGLLVHLLGRIPRAGERFLYRGLEIDVLAASATRVERVAARRGPVRAQVLEPGEPGTRP